MTDSPLRYGVIGSGMMGIEHMHNIAHVDGAVVTAIADPHGPSQDAARDAAPGTELAVFDDYRELLDADLCDAVVIATPNMTHINVLRDVLPTDLHVLIEKPLCTTVADCLEAIELAADRSGIVWVGLEYRYMPPVAQLISETHAGAVGSVQMVSIREHRFPFLQKVDDWNRFSRNTGGTLVEKTCHYFDLMNVITKRRPVRVMASGGQNVNHLDEFYDGEQSDILDNAYVIVEYDDGVRALLDLCMYAEATHNQEQLQVVGDTGKLEALIPENVIRRGRRGEHWMGSVETEPVRDDSIRFEGYHHGSSYLEHIDFVSAIADGTAPKVTLEDGLWSVAMGAAAHRSIDEQRFVDLAEFIPG
ncbi:MAG: Gfo/Idh/MocA family oxidoreductase [Acidimicrobiales bacterium]|nr:Gfo/Idh/MocA family oxidoreductase [Acidimicrobiales bacterium]